MLYNPKRMAQPYGLIIKMPIFKRFTTPRSKILTDVCCATLCGNVQPYVVTMKEICFPKL